MSEETEPILAASERELCFEGARLERAGRPVLQELNLKLTEARVVLLGPNGSGKSSFLRLLAGLLPASHGQLRVHGLDASKQLPALRKRVGFLFQNPEHQLILPTVEEDLGFSLDPSLAATERKARIEEQLRRFGLESLSGRPVMALSGGEQQLVAIAGVLIGEPALLLCDEITTLLDHRNRRRILDLLFALPQQLVMTTHDLEAARRFERVLVLDEGRIVKDGAPEEVVPYYKAEYC